MNPQSEAVTAVVASVPTFSFGFDLTITMGVIVTVVVAILGWSHTRWKAIHARIDTGAERLDRHEGRIGKIEQDMNHLPAKQDVHNIQIAMTEMHGELREMRAASTAANERAQRQDIVLQRVEDYLMKDNRR